VAAPPRRWGWHQLDRRWAQHLVDAADFPPGAVVLDIGAGTGAITAPLLEARARVIAVEAHPARARHLRDRFGGRVTVARADAADLRLPRRPFHVVANPPFAVTDRLLRRLLQPGSRLRSAHLILQEQAARRWASPAAPGYPRWIRSFEVRTGPRVPRGAFRPVPPVDARILVIRCR
jgi:23S rRNA (adenine-N6)-dimethyltransferase